MVASKHDFFKMIFKCFLCVVAVYLLFTPVFYLYNKNLSSAWVYIAANILQFLAVIAVGVFYQRKNSSILSCEQAQYVRIGILCGLIVMVVLHIAYMPERWYGVVTSSLGIYDAFSDNLFVVVLIERLFDNYLITSFLVCTAIACFKPMKKQNGNTVLTSNGV